MLISRLLILTLFIGCAGPGRQMLVFMPKKSYSEYLQEFNSCTGKGMIDSNGPLKGKLSFVFKSQRDSTFFQFGDALGRKVLLMWITPNSVTARNLIENKQYNYDKENDHNATLPTASLMVRTSSSSPGHDPSSRQPTISQM